MKAPKNRQELARTLNSLSVVAGLNGFFMINRLETFISPFGAKQSLNSIMGDDEFQETSAFPKIWKLKGKNYDYYMPPYFSIVLPHSWEMKCCVDLLEEYAALFISKHEFVIEKPMMAAVSRIRIKEEAVLATRISDIYAFTVLG